MVAICGPPPMHDHRIDRGSCSKSTMLAGNAWRYLGAHGMAAILRRMVSSYTHACAPSALGQDAGLIKWLIILRDGMKAISPFRCGPGSIDWRGRAQRAYPLSLVGRGWLREAGRRVRGFSRMQASRDRDPLRRFAPHFQKGEGSSSIPPRPGAATAQHQPACDHRVTPVGAPAEQAWRHMGEKVRSPAQQAAATMKPKAGR